MKAVPDTITPCVHLIASPYNWALRAKRKAFPETLLPVGQPRSLFPKSILVIGPRMGFALLLALFLLVRGSTVVSCE